MSLGQDPLQKKLVVWDLPTRLVHWGVALSILLNLFVIEEGEDWHQWLGYLAVALVAFRLIRGVSSQGALKFALKPQELLNFTKSLIRRRLLDYPGHNPLASYVYLFVWSHVFALGLTGWMMSWDRYWGEEWLEDLHSGISTSLQILILVHLLGIAHDAFHFKRKTWMGMIDGRK